MPSTMKPRVHLDALYILPLCALVVGAAWAPLICYPYPLNVCPGNTSTHILQYCMCKNETGQSTEKCCYYVERPSIQDQRDENSDGKGPQNSGQHTECSESQPPSPVSQDRTYVCSLPVSHCINRAELSKDVPEIYSALIHSTDVLGSQIDDLKTELNGINVTLKNDILHEADSLKQHLETLWQDFNTNILHVNKTLEAFYIKLNGIQEQCQESSSLTRKNEYHLNRQLVDIRENQNDAKAYVAERLYKIDEQITNTINSHDQLSNKQSHMNETLTTDLLNLNESLHSMEKTLNEQLETLKKKHAAELSALKQDIDRERRNLSIQRELLELANSTLTQRILQLEARFDENVKLISKNVSSHKAIIDVIYPNTFDKGASVLVIMLLFVWIIVMTIFLCRLRSKLNTEVQGGRVALRKDINFTRALHDGSLEKKLGIVYFNPRTKEIIGKVLAQLGNRLPEDVRDRVLTAENNWIHVKSHEDGCSLPNTKMCLLFAEFHERHVIIEEPGLGLGDLKRKTVEALNDAGVSIVIMYVRHSSSKQLGEDSLFHEEIYCAMRQPELKVFSDAGRFFSIYDTCSAFQTQKLCDVLKEFLL